MTTPSVTRAGVEEDRLHRGEPVRGGVGTEPKYRENLIEQVDTQRHKGEQRGGRLVRHSCHSLGIEGCVPFLGTFTHDLLAYRPATPVGPQTHPEESPAAQTCRRDLEVVSSITTVGRGKGFGGAKWFEKGMKLFAPGFLWAPGRVPPCLGPDPLGSSPAPSPRVEGVSRRGGGPRAVPSSHPRCTSGTTTPVTPAPTTRASIPGPAEVGPLAHPLVLVRLGGGRGRSGPEGVYEGSQRDNEGNGRRRSD